MWFGRSYNDSRKGLRISNNLTSKEIAHQIQVPQLILHWENTDVCVRMHAHVHVHYMYITCNTFTMHFNMVLCMIVKGCE